MLCRRSFGILMTSLPLLTSTSGRGSVLLTRDSMSCTSHSKITQGHHMYDVTHTHTHTHWQQVCKLGLRYSSSQLSNGPAASFSCYSKGYYDFSCHYLCRHARTCTEHRCTHIHTHTYTHMHILITTGIFYNAYHGRYIFTLYFVQYWSLLTRQKWAQIRSSTKKIIIMIIIIK